MHNKTTAASCIVLVINGSNFDCCRNV